MARAERDPEDHESPSHPPQAGATENEKLLTQDDYYDANQFHSTRRYQSLATLFTLCSMLSLSLRVSIPSCLGFANNLRFTDLMLLKEISWIRLLAFSPHSILMFP